MNAQPAQEDRFSSQAIGYINGLYVPLRELKLSVFDQGIVHGMSVTEMLRTFSGQLYQIEPHLERLQRSAESCGIRFPWLASELSEILTELVTKNFDLLEKGLELGLIISVTSGLNPTYTGCKNPAPTLFAHPFILPGELWAKSTLEGQHLAVSNIPQIPDECLPPTAKSRSRMSFVLADQDVQSRYPGARAILLDQFGYVRETSTANIFVVRNKVLMTPPENSVLPGISRKIALQIAEKLEIPTQEKTVTIDDLLQAEEIFTTSTPYCLLGVSRLNSTAAGLEFPGPVTRQILAGWNAQVGLDIHQQLRNIATIRLQTS